MFCYSVYLKSKNKQIRVFPYSPLVAGDYLFAEKKARAFADAQASNGEPCTVERFGACDVGILDYDTDAKQ